MLTTDLHSAQVKVRPSSRADPVSFGPAVLLACYTSYSLTEVRDFYFKTTRAGDLEAILRRALQ